MDPRPAALDLWGIEYRRWALRISAALIALWLVFDLFSPGTTRVVLAARFLWSACLLCASLFQRPERPRLASLSTIGATVATALASVAVVAGRDDGHLVGLGFLLAMPLIGLAVTPRVTSTAVLASAITVPGGATILINMGSPFVEVAEWVSLAAISAIASAYCTRVNRREAERAIAAERERARAVEGLAESERQRALAERLAVVGRLTAGVAHEMNNPLSYVRSNLQWIRSHPGQDAAQNEELREVLDDTLAGVDRIAKIVSDLRAFTGHRSEAQAPCRLDEALEEALRLASVRLKGVRVERHVPPGLPPVHAPEGRIVQSLVNLLANAGDALAGQQPPASRWVRVAAVREGASVRLDVEDGGPGLPPEVATRLFEPFFTTKGSGGTGLGLYLTREFLGRLGGSIEVGQAPGGGARFTMRMPVEVEEAAAQDSPYPLAVCQRPAA